MAETHFIGIVTADPQISYVPNTDRAVLKIRVAENHSYYDKQRQDWVQTGTTWREIELWGDRAQKADTAGHYRKGDRVLVAGREQTRAWKTKAGEDRQTLFMRDPQLAVLPKATPTTGTDARNNLSNKPGGCTPPPNDSWGQPPADMEPPF